MNYSSNPGTKNRWQFPAAVLVAMGGLSTSFYLLWKTSPRAPSVSRADIVPPPPGRQHNVDKWIWDYQLSAPAVDSRILDSRPQITGTVTEVGGDGDSPFIVIRGSNSDEYGDLIIVNLPPIDTVTESPDGLRQPAIGQTVRVEYSSGMTYPTIPIQVHGKVISIQ